MSWHFVFGLAMFLLAFAAWPQFELRGDSIAVGRWSALVFGGLIVAVVCARIAFISFELPTYLSNPRAIFDLGHGGYIYSVGLLGLVVFFFIYTRVTDMSGWETADRVARSAALYLGLELLGDALLGFAPFGFDFAAAFFFLAIFGALYWLRARRPFAGEAALLFTVAFILYRLLRSRLGAAPAPGTAIAGPLTTTDIVSIVLLITAAIIFAVRRQRATV